MKIWSFPVGIANRKAMGLAALSTLLLFCGLSPVTVWAAPAIVYVQGNYAAPQTPQTTVNVTFSVAQTIGDLNVVAVGWNDQTATVTSVTDKSGNAYTRAVGPTGANGLSQSIYYAKNIAGAAAGANTVTVIFSVAAVFPDIRILEYSGADPINPLDVAAFGSGTTSTASSAAVTTTSATDLLFGADMTATLTAGPGTGFTSRLLTSPDGDIAEDRLVAAIGSYSATAPISPAGPWVMQMVAFRAASGDITPPTAPSSLTAAVSGNRINLSWTASTDNVGVAGYRVERCQGTGCANFTQIASPTATSYGDPGLAPGSYSYRVRAMDASGNLSLYSNTGSGVIADTTAPTAPSGLTAMVSGSQINLSWTASTDNVGTTGYMVERCSGAGCANFAQIGTTATTTYSDTSLAVGSYSYRVRATDAAANLSSYSNTASGAITDSTPPTAPSGLSATVSGNLINLAWAASTDNVGVTGYRVERCQGTACSTFAQIAAPTTTSYSDTSLGAGSYSYRVRATDAAGNLSGYSNVASGVIPDTQPPSAPGSLTASAASSSQVNLSWTASTDNVGVTSYRLERCQGAGCTNFAQIAAPTTTSYNDTGLTPSTSYSYRLLAVDAANNLSPYSNIAAAVTAASTAPTAPANLAALTGGPAPTVAAVQGYINSTALTSHTTTAFDSTGGDAIVICASSHAGVTLTPSDNFGNTWTTIAGPTSTTLGVDLRTQVWYAANPIVGPGHTVTMNLSAAQSLVISIIVAKKSNSASPVDAVSAIGSNNGISTQNIVTPAITTAAANDLLIGFAKTSSSSIFQPGPGFTQQAAASSDFLDAETGTTGAAGSYNASFTVNIFPTWQSAAVAVANNPNQTSLSWAASTESGGTIGNYLVERCLGASCSNFVQIDTIAGTTYNDTGLAAATSYSYRVRAQDTAGNVGPYSNTTSVTTPTPVPTPPWNLTAMVASGTQINLSWSPSTEAGGSVTSYLVERCLGVGCTNFTQIGTSTATTYSDPGLGAGNYSYRVRAKDAAGNSGSYSNLAGGVIPDTQPPGAPTGLTATAAGVSQIGLSWTAAADNVGVTGYLVERCQGAGCTSFAQIATPSGATYNDSGLAANTDYSYRVRATDVAGNLSPYSNVASATTLAIAPIVTYVQGNYAAPQSPQTKVNVTFTAAQLASDLNVVAVGWNDTTTAVTSVTDTNGNTYVRAVGPTAGNGLSQSIYYAPNIVPSAAGTNVVIVTFSVAAAYPDVRILEYKGADPLNPIDVVAAASGSSATASSGAAATTTASDLIFGADMTSTLTNGAGAGFSNRLLTSPDGDIAEDRVVTAAGSYGASAPISPAGAWIMQMAAFRAGAGDTTPPTAPSGLATAVNGTQMNLSWTASTDNVGVTGYLIERCQGSACVNFAQVGTATTAEYLDTGLTANTSYSYRVRARDAAGNLGAYSNIASATTLTASLAVAPRVAVVTFTGSQQFTSNGGSVTWSVDGVTGGSASSGTITSTGVYTPVNSAGVHTVTATTSSDQTASATVHISNYAGTLTFHNDNLRTGQNNNETVLAPANVNQAQFGKLFAYALDGYAYSSPLYVANVNLPGKGFHNVVYVATEHDSLYAFDADGLSGAPLWKVSFLLNGATTVPCADVGECGDIPNEIGITSTPVIDPNTGTLYLVAKTKEAANYVQRLHAIDITTGTEKFGGPVVIHASTPGAPPEGGTSVVFNALRENQRAGLLLTNGVLYLAFGSHGDQSPWHGWVLAYNPSTLQQGMVYTATPNANGAGIWQSGGGLATDASGDLFFTTGNGDFDANTGGKDYGDTVLKLSTTGSVIDYFTPHDQLDLSNTNIELGSAGPVLLLDQPGSAHPHLLITAGKNGTIYVVDRDNMGHYNPGSDSQIVQSLPGALLHSDQENGNYSSPVYFNGNVYFAACSDTLKSFQLSNGLLSTTPTSQSVVSYPYRGGSFAISANGTADGVLWAMQDNNPSPGVLRAYDANNLSTELYDSSQAGTRDALADSAAKFSIPLVANGKVFVVSLSSITAYGLLP